VITFSARVGLSQPRFGQTAPMIELPYDLDRYFTRDEKTREYGLEVLESTRARPKGIRNANAYMWAAYQGDYPKRKPISLKDNGDGTYAIRDGNSTFANAQASKWETILGRVLTDAEFEAEEAAKRQGRQ
jgi:hypothetical protein